MSLTSFADFTNAFSHLSAALTANSQDLPQLAAQHEALKAALATASTLSSRRDAVRADLQQATADLKAQMTLARAAYSRLRHGLRQQYGPTSDKLVEFGVKPAGRRVKKKATPPDTPTPATA
ncbi:MAG TPA: hypothetical protein VGE98_09945, partial [Thermoanaerobaculia bacterium]